MQSRYNVSVAARKPNEFRWFPFDAIIARAFGVILDVAEMESLVVCVCAFPNIDASDHCVNCKLKFVWDPNRLPKPPAPPTETE